MRRHNHYVFQVILLLVLLPGVIGANYYEIDVEYNKGNLSTSLVRVIPSAEVLENVGADYIAEVLAYDFELRNITYFSIPHTILYDDVDENGKVVSGGTTTLDYVTHKIYVPYYEDAVVIRVYDENLEEKLIIDLFPFVEDDIVKDIEKTVQEFEMKNKSEKKFPMALLILFGLVLLAGVVYLILHIKKSK